jgi:hypothetical protein
MTNQQQPELEQETIASRAFQLFEARGCEHGHDVEDWLAAEEQLRAENTSQTEKSAPSQNAAA